MHLHGPSVEEIRLHRASEHEEPLDDDLGVVDLVDDQVEGLLHFERIVGAAAPEDFEVPTHHRQRCSQLVRDIREQAPLGRHRGLDSIEHGVKGPREFSDLVVAPLVTQTLIQRAAPDLVGGGGNASHLAQ